MDGVQSNGEPKKIYLSKPENGNIEERPTTSRRFSVEIQGQKPVYIPPSRRPRPDNSINLEDEEHVTNHKKQRYWNSYEEMFIVELWRRYRDEVTEFNKPLPVHRKIMVAMRQKEMIVTGQDCRRKLNTLNNRYKTELQSQKLTGVKPEWRLFPLIHCLKVPKIKQFDPWHETLVVRKLLEKVPKPPEMVTQAPPPTISPQSAPRQPLLTSQTHTNRATAAKSTGQLIASIPLQSIMGGVNSLIAMDNCTTTSSTTLAINNCNHLTALERVPLPIRHVTLQKLEQLKLDNARLAKQRDEALESYKIAERNLRVFELTLNQIMRNMISPVDSGIQFENEENTHVEKLGVK